MIATGGFGAFPNNPLTQSFQDVVSENVSAEYLDPFNSYMENISAPTIQPQPASDPGNDSPPDPLSVLVELFTGDTSTSLPQLLDESEIVETAMVSLAETQTQIVVTLNTSSPIATQNLIQTSIPTTTAMMVLPSPTDLPGPTWTAPPVVIFPTSTKKPTKTLTPMPTLTDTVVPFLGFSVTAVDLNGAGSSIVVAPGNPVNVSYNFDVYDDPCPGCITQLVTGLGTAGSHGGACAFNGDTALFPGTPGSEVVTLSAPLTPGLYPVVVEYYWENDCTNALNLYGTGSGQQAPPQTIGQIDVQLSACIVSSDLVSIPGENWYFGNTFCSCDDVCGTRGGVNLAALDTVGDDADGGTNAKCAQVLDLFLAGGSTVDWAGIGAFVGCHLDTNGNWRARYVGETALSSASGGNIQRVCACNN